MTTFTIKTGRRRGGYALRDEDGPRPATGGSRHRVAVAGLTLALLTAGCSSPGRVETGPRSSTTEASPTAVGSDAAGSSSAASPASPATSSFAELEHQYNARLGVYALDTGSGRTVRYRDGERFAYASTIKAMAAATVLQKTSSRELDKVVRYDRSELMAYSPITKQHLRDGMTLGDVCEAAVRYSDNTAGNLMFRELGGPAVLERQLEAVGDRTTVVSRNEPGLNEATPGDRRDTSTPVALATDLHSYVLDNTLTAPDKKLLTQWLRGNPTGKTLVEAGAPAEWVVGDKSGAASFGTRNDIAVLWPPDQAPVVIAVMSSRSTTGAKYDDALIADATRTTLRQLG